MNSKGRRKHNRNNRLVSLGRGAANVISRAEAETLELKARLEEHRKEALGNMEQLTKIMARLAELETANDKISETDNKRLWTIRDLEASDERLTKELIDTHESHEKEVSELHLRRVEDAKAAADKVAANDKELEKLRGMELDSVKIRRRLQERSDEVYKLEQQIKTLTQTAKTLTGKVEDLTTALFVEKQKHSKATTSAAITVSKEA
ncbi:MAG: hypothetical protein A2Y38_17225 [Spirochaetes bacterium GWB1_59_5]|nr:MAG: hypothetical protein A2Y38_17225 [Spirochaetes bacterium GWB1_59_5]